MVCMTQYNSEKERMLAGELYVAADPELGEANMRKRRLVHEINTMPYDKLDERMKLFHELFAELGEGSFIEAPFNCDYGSNTRIGRNFYANMDCIFLDVAPITDCTPRIIRSTPRCAMPRWKAVCPSPSAATSGSAATSSSVRA